MFHSKLIYCIEAFGFGRKEDIDLLFRRYTTDLLFAELDLIPLPKLIEINLITMMHNILNENIHSNTSFMTNSANHGYLTRRRNELRNNRNFTSTYGTNSIMTKGIQLYNGIPPHLKCINNIIVFKKEIRKFICDRQ